MSNATKYPTLPAAGVSIVVKKACYFNFFHSSLQHCRIMVPVSRQWQVRRCLYVGQLGIAWIDSVSVRSSH